MAAAAPAIETGAGAEAAPTPHQLAKTVSAREWTPSSWRGLPILQQPAYEDQALLSSVLAKVSRLPPIVHYLEVDQLKASLAQACEGKLFLLQGGDCAERFDECTQDNIEKKFKILLQMSLIIIWSSRVPVVRVARMAGQFAKPRTSDFEMNGDQRISSYKGDSINGFETTDRKHDPNRLLGAYFHSVSTQNYLRAMISGGVSDLHAAPQWRLDNVLSKQVREEYETVVEKIIDGLNFYETIHAQAEATKSVSLFSSHEGLILDYEEALTRRVPGPGRYYNLSAHFLWIGDRTRQLDGAHIEYFRGIENPIGVKIGPSTKPDQLAALIQVLNPRREPGHLTLITRYGVDVIDKALPEHIQAVKATNIPVLWVCDPCHGNTESTSNGFKTRSFEKMMGELVKAFKIHAANGSHLGGVHLELTGDDVTECVGGSAEVATAALSTNYQSFCDPRLNYTQSLDMAFCVARELRSSRDATKAQESTASQ